MDYGNDVDISEVLPATFKGLSIRESDETLLVLLLCTIIYYVQLDGDYYYVLLNVCM